MEENKIKWCLNQKRGIELVDKNQNLSDSYLMESKEDFKEVENVGEKWKIIISYYCCYEAFYSILLKCGIKSEIHDYSLELMQFFEFNEEEIEFLKKLKDLRKMNQYYLKRNILETKENVKKFISKCEEIISDLNSEKIEGIRIKIQELKNE